MTTNLDLQGCLQFLSGTHLDAQGAAQVLVDLVTVAAQSGPPGVVVSPLATIALGQAAWPTANRAIAQRIHLPVGGTFRYVNVDIGVQSGNIQASVVRLSGTDRLSFTRLMTTGSIACPAAGVTRLDLGATVVNAGDLAIVLWADNTTFQARQTFVSSGITSSRLAAYVDAVGGIGASGTFAAWTQYAICGLSLEANV